MKPNYDTFFLKISCIKKQENPTNYKKINFEEGKIETLHRREKDRIILL